MADVLSQANLFSSSSSSPFNVYKNHQKNSSCRLKGFPGKVNHQALRLQTTSLGSDFHGKRVVLQENIGNPKRDLSSKTQECSNMVGKGLQPNMREVTSAQDLVDSLLDAGDKLVIVDFFSPGCGGCKALHPKICQLAEMNPDVQFLQIKKFKDALAKHSQTDAASGQQKGWRKKSLLLWLPTKINFTRTPKPDQPTTPAPVEEEIVPALPQSHLIPTLPLPLPLPLPLAATSLKSGQDSEEKPWSDPGDDGTPISVSVVLLNWFGQINALEKVKLQIDASRSLVSESILLGWQPFRHIDI
ncbi:hypothetical protein GH714_005246 [Hevea brasiliensis]|uniref:Thioredoxin domain-containing protein n=1 Tax=Hevea brasiliensis TaxID=3981 RepID=A0A6A6KII4_HEVBR|nr:hypothetical protein GH714_005246 [Hevea brasiliensis]